MQLCLYESLSKKQKKKQKHYIIQYGATACVVLRPCFSQLQLVEFLLALRARQVRSNVNLIYNITRKPRKNVRRGRISGFNDLNTLMCKYRTGTGNNYGRRVTGITVEFTRAYSIFLRIFYFFFFF